MKTDWFGRKIPKHAHGTINLESYTSSTKQILAAVVELYDRIVDKNLLVRRLNLVANHVLREKEVPEHCKAKQLKLFDDYRENAEEKRQNEAAIEREKSLQQAMLTIKKKYGKNAILKGMNMEEGATAADRNMQIGGHKA